MSDSSRDPASVGHVSDDRQEPLRVDYAEDYIAPALSRGKSVSELWSWLTGRSRRRQPSQEDALLGQVRQSFEENDPEPEGMRQRTIELLRDGQASTGGLEEAQATEEHGSKAQEPVNPDLARASSDTRSESDVRTTQKDVTHFWNEVVPGPGWLHRVETGAHGVTDNPREVTCETCLSVLGKRIMSGDFSLISEHPEPDPATEALAGLAHMAGGEPEEARAREIARVVHHLPTTTGDQVVRPTCGAGVLDWFKATSSWGKVTCERCLEVGRGLGDLGAPKGSVQSSRFLRRVVTDEEIKESPASDERPESISMTLPAGTPVEFMDGDRVVGSGHARPDGSVTGSVSHPFTTEGLTIRLADGSEKPYETHLEKARMAREDLVDPEDRQGIARERPARDDKERWRLVDSMWHLVSQDSWRAACGFVRGLYGTEVVGRRPGPGCPVCVAVADGGTPSVDDWYQRKAQAFDAALEEGEPVMLDAQFLRSCHSTRLYWCPTAREIECLDHGGFDTCCDRPDLHWDIDRIERFLRHGTEASDASQERGSL